MKKTFLTISALLISAVAAIAQFEGTFTMTLESPKFKEPMDMNMTVKGNLTCMEIPSMAASGMVKSIINTQTQDMIICNDRGGRKIGMKTNMKDAERFMPQSSNAKPPVVTETAETKTIDGYKCKKTIIESEEATSDLWISTDVPLNMKDLLTTVSANRSPGSYMLRNLQRGYGEMKGVALEVNSVNKKTKEEFKLTLHSIKQTKVDDKIFNTDDFQLMDMPNMGGGQIQK